MKNCLIVLVLMLPAPVWAGTFVNDEAGLLESPAQLEEVAGELWGKTGISLHLVTLTEAGGETFADKAVALLDIGGQNGRGLVVLVSPVDKTIYVHKGALLNLEPGAIDNIRQRIMIPWLQKGQYQQGLLAGMQALAWLVADNRETALSFARVEMPQEPRRWRHTPMEPRYLWVLLAPLFIYLVARFRKNYLQKRQDL